MGLPRYLAEPANLIDAAYFAAVPAIDAAYFAAVPAAVVDTSHTFLAA